MEAKHEFIIDTLLITPVTKIIAQLNNDEFRDCDINWLDNKLDKFITFTLKTLGLNIKVPGPIEGKVLNDYVKKQYLERFSILLDYFKNLNDEN